MLRRLVRRAARYGQQSLGMDEPFLFQVVPAVAEILGSVFPEVRERVEHIQLLLREEEKSFGRTLGRGLVRFEKLAKQKQPGTTLPGDDVFDLYATYGFPRDLVELMARERGLEIDGVGWDSAERQHQEASKGGAGFKQFFTAEQLAELDEKFREMASKLPD